jgi:Aspartyl protease
MTSFKRLACILLAVTLVPALHAETHCPGDVASVPLRLVNGYQMMVAVSVDHSGPYEFLLDTGAQFTMIDPSLAAELHLRSNGSLPVAGNGFQTTSAVVHLDRLEVGPHAVANLEALLFDVQNIRPHYANLRGILGEDFLLQFDMLIDNGHRMLCLDNSSVLRAVFKGPRVALETGSGAERVPPNTLIFATRLSDGTRPIRLKLDSGANAPVLFNVSQFRPVDLYMGGSLRGSAADGLQRDYIALPPQGVTIGPLKLSNIPFFAPAGAKNISNTSDFDGLLPLRLFQRVFICNAERFAILEAR